MLRLHIRAHVKMAALGMLPARPLAMVFEKAARANASNNMTDMRAYQVGINDCSGTL